MKGSADDFAGKGGQVRKYQDGIIPEEGARVVKKLPKKGKAKSQSAALKGY